MYGFGKGEKYEIVGFLTAINLEDDEGENLGVALTLRQLNQTYYQYTFTVPSTTRLYFASFYRLIFDTNLPTSTSGIIITSVSQTYTPGNPSPYFPDSIQLPFSSLMVGLSGVEFSKQPNVSFAFDGNGSVSGEYNVVTLNVVEFKGYSCPGGLPYYYHETGYCYQNCPAGTYSVEGGDMVCGKCHAECRTCDGGSNRSCLSCYDEDKIEVVGQGKSCVKRACDPQCLTCSEGGESPPVCTSCDASAGLLLKSGTCVCSLPAQVYDPSENLCVDCSTLHASPCLTCTLSACLTCKQNSTMSVDTPGTCVCDANFVFSTTSTTCLPCTSIPGCLTCHNLSACARCQPSMLLINSQCFCPLSSQFFNPDLSKCSNCRSSCATCLSETQCLTCRPEKNTVLNANHQCVCPINHAMSPTLAICVRTKCPAGYTLAPPPATPDPSNTTINCQEICGDGKLFELECDDGNLENGDGCSAGCEVEEGYSCVNGTEWSPSVCGWNGEVRFEFVGREEGAVVFKVEPAGLKGMERVDFAGGIRLVGGDGKKKESLRGVTAEYEDGLLRLMMAQDWEGAGGSQDVVALEFTAPPGNPTLFAIRPSPLTFPPPLTSPLLRSFSSTISTVFSCTTTVSLVLLFLPAAMLPALSLSSLLQTTYIAQFLPSTLAPLYLPYLSHPATKPLTLGPNFLPEPLETVSFQGVVEYSRYFIGNVNLMTVAQIVMMVLGQVLGGWRVGGWLKGEGVERLAGYGVVNVGFCLGLEVLGWGSARGEGVGMGVEIGNILGVVVTIVLNLWILSRSPRRSRPTTIFFAFRFLTSFLLSFFLHSPHTPLFLLLLHYLYLTYLLLSSPSFEAGMRNAVVELTLIFQLSVVYAFSGDLRPTSKQLIGVGMVHMVLVLFCGVYCGYCVCGGEGEGEKGGEAIRGGSGISVVSGRGSQGGSTGDGEGRDRGQGGSYEIEEPKDSMQFFDIEEPAKDEIE